MICLGSSSGKNSILVLWEETDLPKLIKATIKLINVDSIIRYGLFPIKIVLSSFS